MQKPKPREVSVAWRPRLASSRAGGGTGQAGSRLSALNTLLSRAKTRPFFMRLLCSSTFTYVCGLSPEKPGAGGQAEGVDCGCSRTVPTWRGLHIGLSAFQKDSAHKAHLSRRGSTALHSPHALPQAQKGWRGTTQAPARPGNAAGNEEV